MSVLDERGRTVKPARCFFVGGSTSLLSRRVSLRVLRGFLWLLLDVDCVDLLAGLRDMTRGVGKSPNMSTTTTDLQTFKTRNPLFQRDLFHCILDCLVAPEASPRQFRESRSVLVSLAQTCRAFSEPSLDRLWSKLDSLEPLIRCFATVLNEERAKVG